jgi:chromosome segregation ATPase
MTNVERESINFRLPKTLLKKLRFAARERKTTATQLVILGLQQILDDVPGTNESIENRLHKLEEDFLRLQENIDNLSPSSQSNIEIKIEELSYKLARFEGAFSQMQNSIKASRSRGKSSSAYPYQNSIPAKLEPRNEEELAVRLGTSPATIQEKRATLSQKDFEQWTQDRDFTRRSWRFNEKDGLYYPIT